MIGFWGGAQNEKSGPAGARARNGRFYKKKYRNPALEAPGLDIIHFMKSLKKIAGFWEGAQNAKSGHRGARARNERFYKEKY